MLRLLGKSPVSAGIITVVQLLDAIDRITQAIDLDGSEGSDHALLVLPPDASREPDDDENDLDWVSKRTRYAPLLRMLRASVLQQCPVTWAYKKTLLG